MLEKINALVRTCSSEMHTGFPLLQYNQISSDSAAEENDHDLNLDLDLPTLSHIFSCRFLNLTDTCFVANIKTAGRPRSHLHNFCVFNTWSCSLKIQIFRLL